MHSHLLFRAIAPLLILGVPVSFASPTAIPVAAPVADAAPDFTGSPVQWAPSKTAKSRRDLLGDTVSSVLSDLGSNIPTYVADGVADFFQDFPSGGAVQSSLGLDSTQVAALPTQVLNLPCVVVPLPSHHALMGLAGSQTLRQLDQCWLEHSISRQRLQAAEHLRGETR